MLGDNIKVHFAGLEGSEIFHAALLAADVKYRLFSCYKYILNKKIDDNFMLPKKDIIVEQQFCNNHVIQDSGLFTLMFGAAKGKKIDLDFLINWQDKLIKFVQQNNLNCTCVEVDCQKVLGVEEAWFLRKRMRDKLQNKQINVFHFEDGKDGLDKLIDFSEYIAISVPELRIVKPKTYKKDVCSLAKYIKNKKPQIDIHLLGCTEFELLKQNAFCTSADSTSWLQGVKFGEIDDGHKKGHVDSFKDDLFLQRQQEIQKILLQRNVVFKPKTLKYSTNASLSATICKKRYTYYTGDQN